MQGYANAATALTAPLRVSDPSAPSTTTFVGEPGKAIVEQLLGELAEFVAARVTERLMSPRRGEADEWLDTRRAAEYLGIHRDSLRRLAAEGTNSNRTGGSRMQAVLPAHRPRFLAVRGLGFGYRYAGAA